MKRRRRSGRLCRTIVSVTVFAAASTSVLAAQQPAQQPAQQSAEQSHGAIDGGVVDTAGAAMPGVDIILMDDSGRDWHSTPAGGYRIDSVPPGPHLLRFRRLGLKPLTVPVLIKPNEITSVDAILEPMPQQLAAIVVQSSRGEMIRMPAGLADRMKHGLGHYITYDDIERQKPLRTSDLLSSIPGVQISGSGFAASTRGTTTLTDAVDAHGVHTVTYSCAGGMAVYIDDVAVPSTDSTDSPLNLIPPSDIVGIEVYKSPIEASAALPVPPCGAIFIWTRQ